MGAKIIGFHKKHTTRQNLKEAPVFMKAVKTAAEVLSAGDVTKYSELCRQMTTKRQAAKFFQRKGLVFDTVNGENDGV